MNDVWHFRAVRASEDHRPSTKTTTTLSAKPASWFTMQAVVVVVPRILSTACRAWGAPLRKTGIIDSQILWTATLETRHQRYFGPV